MGENIVIDSSLRTVEWKNNKVIMIEQTKLPNKLIFVEYDDFNQVANPNPNAPDTPIAGAPLTIKVLIAFAT